MTYRTGVGPGLFVVALLCAGCGTVRNLGAGLTTTEGDTPTPTRIYGGVRQDWADLKAQRFDDVYCMNLIFLPLYLADFPFSLVGDTLTLPYTAGVEVVRSLSTHYLKPPARSEQPTQGGNVLAPFADNVFSPWTMTHRVDFPIQGTSPPRPNP